MDFSKKSSAVLAASAAALLLSGAVNAPASAGMKSKVKCYGVNACKGQAACKGAKMLVLVIINAKAKASS